jgi:hypothetical protein
LSYPYASNKCTSLLESCKELAKLRHPKGFSEDPHKVGVFGDLDKIKDHLRELESQ